MRWGRGGGGGVGGGGVRRHDGRGGFRVAIGYREAAEFPGVPLTRLCSRRGTVPADRDTRVNTHSHTHQHTFKAYTDLGLNHSIALQSHLLHNVTHIDLTTQWEERHNQTSLL